MMTDAIFRYGLFENGPQLTNFLHRGSLKSLNSGTDAVGES